MCKISTCDKIVIESPRKEKDGKKCLQKFPSKRWFTNGVLGSLADSLKQTDARRSVGIIYLI